MRHVKNRLGLHVDADSKSGSTEQVSGDTDNATPTPIPSRNVPEDTTMESVYDTVIVEDHGDKGFGRESNRLSGYVHGGCRPSVA